MREIKFRAYDTETKEMCYEFLDRNWLLVCIKSPFVELMQYTGLNDIYEDDIVETSHHIYDGGIARINQVCFKDFCWRLVAIGDAKANDIPLGLYATHPETIKKIGNIYENPELLHKESENK